MSFFPIFPNVFLAYTPPITAVLQGPLYYIGTYKKCVRIEKAKKKKKEAFFMTRVFCRSRAQFVCRRARLSGGTGRDYTRLLHVHRYITMPYLTTDATRLYNYMTVQ